MKIIKNRLRTTVNQDRLIWTFLSIGDDLLIELDFNETVELFDSQKVRKQIVVTVKTGCFFYTPLHEKL